MNQTPTPSSGDVDQLLRNAELRDELEPYMDESIACLANAPWSLEQENDYLASMLAWEQAPALPIAEWFDPPLTMPDARGFSEDELQEILWDTIHRLYEKRIVLKHTDHLSDAELYSVLKRDILPAREKKVETSGHYVCWDCVDPVNDSETWLRYYAGEEEREQWADTTDLPLPARKVPLYPRPLPGHGAC